ncbi:MFS transporter [Nesterenkonia ebinurensis]|uniref:MFS transporter n=1 Tax=Nesterenkonia ebinurensis TaxID=2608252 RepID=UPI00123DE2C3|nr:MFS transporter [Nesterenkonia ebinurensis]
MPDQQGRAPLPADGSSVRRILWAAGFGAAGTSILSVANDLVAVLALDAGPAQIGVLNALESVSYLALSVPAGWLLDRIDRKKALLWIQAIATIAVVSVPVAWLLDSLTFSHLAVASFFVGTAGMVWGLGLSSILPSVVDKRAAGSAFGKLQSVETATGLVIPGLTGAVLLVLAAPLTLFFAGAAKIIGGLILFTGPPAPKPEDEAEPLKFWAGVSEGFHFTVRSTPILLSTCAAAVANSALALLMAVQTVYLVRELGFSPSLIAVQGTVIGASGFIGSLLAVRLLQRFRGLSTACVATVIATLSALLFPLTALNPDSLVFTLPLITAFNILWNITAVIAAAGKYGLMAALVPSAMMGRVQAFRRLIARGPIPIVAIVGGLLGETIGLVPTLWVFVTLALIACVLHILLWILSRNWDLPDPPRPGTDS